MTSAFKKRRRKNGRWRYRRWSRYEEPKIKSKKPTKKYVSFAEPQQYRTFIHQIINEMETKQSEWKKRLNMINFLTESTYTYLAHKKHFEI